MTTPNRVASTVRRRAVTPRHSHRSSVRPRCNVTPCASSKSVWRLRYPVERRYMPTHIAPIAPRVTSRTTSKLISWRCAATKAKSTLRKLRAIANENSIAGRNRTDHRCRSTRGAEGADVENGNVPAIELQLVLALADNGDVVYRARAWWTKSDDWIRLVMPPAAYA